MPYFQQRLHVLQDYMLGNFCLCTIKIPFINDSYAEFNVSAFNLKENWEQLYIDLMCHFSSVNCIHTKAINFLILKQTNKTSQGGFHSSLTPIPCNFKLPLLITTLQSELSTLTSCQA